MDDTTDTTGTWISTGANRFSQVNDSNTSTYITQTGASGGYAYFGYSPSFSVPAGSTITDVTSLYRKSRDYYLCRRRDNGDCI